MYYKEGGKKEFMKRNLLCLDTVLLAIPLAVGTAIILPFVVYDLTKQLIKVGTEDQ